MGSRSSVLPNHSPVLGLELRVAVEEVRGAADAPLGVVGLVVKPVVHDHDRVEVGCEQPHDLGHD